jgi:hypothetical protein
MGVCGLGVSGGAHQVGGATSAVKGAGGLISDVIGFIEPPREEAFGDRGLALGRVNINTLGEDFENAHGHVGVIRPRTRVPRRQGTFTHFHGGRINGPSELVRGA